MTGSSLPHPVASRNLYGKRIGRPLKDSQRRRVADLLPHVRLPIDPQSPAPVDPLTWFENADRGITAVWLEIGIGSGEHLAAQAAAHRETGLIGVEYFLNGVAKALEHISLISSDPARGNALLHHGDGRDVVDNLTDASLDRLFVLQPDPWPKARHHRRRLISTENLDEWARVLKPDAELRISTDHADYLIWILRHMQAHPAFEWTASSAADFEQRPADWPETRYAAKAIAADRPSTYLAYRRR